MSDCDRHFLDKLAALRSDSDEIHAVLRLVRSRPIAPALLLRTAVASERIRYAYEVRNIFRSGRRKKPGSRQR